MPKTWYCAVTLLSGLILLAAMLGERPEAYAGGDAKKGKKCALLVGVNEYHSAKFASLKYTENDVGKLADMLRDPRVGGFDEIRVLTNTLGQKDRKAAPTAANVRAALESLTARRGRHDTVLIALSGHGLQLEVADPEEDARKRAKPKVYGYFCPHDADLRDKVSYSTGKCRSLIQVQELLDALADCGAGTKLVLMDACRNEMKAQASARSLDVRQFTIPDNTAALFGCKAGQTAFETKRLGHGVFFHFVLKGLGGEAANKRGEVTWDLLAAYVKEHVSDEVPKLIGGGANQEPHGVNNLSGKPPVLARANVPREEGQGTRPKVVVTDSGLKYQDLKVGTGEAARKGDKVEIHYTGWLAKDGSKFDSSVDRKETFTFELGAGRVIKGLDEGLAGMKPGGKRKLTIPGKLAFGENGVRDSIPGNAELIFDVELIKVTSAR